MYQQKISKGNFKDKPNHCVLSANSQSGKMQTAYQEVFRDS